MAQPTQELPPWLTASVSVVTDAAGAPVATDTNIVYVPPTYFGPSIPLGTLYSFGGTTEPPTIVLPGQSTATTTATPSTTPITTTAIPTTSVSISTTSATTSATPTTSVSIPITSSASSSSASSTISSTISLSTASTTSSISTTSPPVSGPSVVPSAITTITAPPTATGGASSFGGLTKGQLVGVIVASILGLIFLFVLALFLFLWCKGRRNRRNFAATSTGIDDDYYFVPPGGRIPGEGSPRHSGEEADPFLQSSGEASGSAAAAAAGGSTATRGSYRSSPLANVAATADTTRAGQTMSQVAGNQAASRPSAVARVAPPTVGSNSSGSASSGSHASGFGVLLDRPPLSGMAYLPITHEHQTAGGRPLSAADMERIDNEQVLPDDIDDQYGDEEPYTGAYAYSRDSHPPRLIVPGSVSQPLLPGGTPEQLPLSGSDPYLSHQASLQDLQEGTLLTATRVRAQDLAPRSSPTAQSPAAGPSHRASGGLLGALGLGGLASIGRMSWFRNIDSPRHSMHGASYSAAPLSEKDLETGRSMLSPGAIPAQADSFGIRPRGTGLSPEGLRPVSNVSARSAASGGTTYHDAQSSLPGTPTLAPLPRAVTPGDISAHSNGNNDVPINEHTWFSSPLSNPSATSDPSSPPAYNPSTPPPHSPTGTSFDRTHGADILDMPVPTAIHHFGSMSSLKETATGSSAGLHSDKGAPFPPPGLETIRPIGWSAAHHQGNVAEFPATSPAPSSGSFAMQQNLGMGMGMNLDIDDDLGLNHGAGISIDVLEEAPPDAEQGWRTISSSGGGSVFMDVGRRGTFGRFVHGQGFMSGQGSLHSMRSHFDSSIRSTGSAPASRREMSINSNSSGRPSAHSAGDGSSGGFSAAAHSLVRMGSISSDEQNRRHGQMSPALSAFGHQSRAAGSSGSSVEPPLSPVIGSPPSAHMGGSDKAPTVRPMGSGTTTLMDTSFATGSTVQPARSLSPLGANFPMNAPWAGGLDSDWQPAV